MNNFFNADVPVVYQKAILTRFLIHLEKKNEDNLFEDYAHYDVFFSSEVQKKMTSIFISLDVYSEKVRKLFEEYGLI